jgi:hypothetical protein
MRPRSIPLWILNGMLACWILMISAGLLLLEAHSVRPGDRGSPTGHWPVDTPLRLNKSRLNLLIFLHPRCPCSRASLVELARIMSRCRGRVSAKAVVFRPDPMTEEWSRSELGIEHALTDLPNVPFCYDSGGVEARRFGVLTSGHVLLFDESGRRIFDGGITPSRGHEGENRGSDDVVALVLDTDGRHDLSSRPATPVFGCPIVRTQVYQDKGS